MRLAGLVVVFFAFFLKFDDTKRDPFSQAAIIKDLTLMSYFIHLSRRRISSAFSSIQRGMETVSFFNSLLNTSYTNKNRHGVVLYGWWCLKCEIIIFLQISSDFKIIAERQMRQAKSSHPTLEHIDTN